jgi:hypothetical protein
MNESSSLDPALAELVEELSNKLRFEEAETWRRKSLAVIKERSGEKPKPKNK